MANDLALALGLSQTHRPTKTASKPPTPQPTATVTVTHTVTSKPDDIPLTDHLQGWGTVAAVVAALVIALIGWTVEAGRRKADKEAGDTERGQDRTDADRRLYEERAAADQQLQRQLDEQRDRDRRAFLIAQIQGAGDLYAENMALKPTQWEERRITPQDPVRKAAWQVAVQRLRAYLPAIPPPYASLLKVQVFGSHSSLIDLSTLREARRRAPDENSNGVGPIDPEEIYRELADNIAEFLGQPIPAAGGLDENREVRDRGE